MFKKFLSYLALLGILIHEGSYLAVSMEAPFPVPSSGVLGESDDASSTFPSHILREEVQSEIDIAVIGGGYTGVLSSILLASLKKTDGSSAAFRVHLYEKDYNLLNGASLIPARLHLGGEYPKDTTTALQCLFSAIIFRQMFPTESILTSRKRIDFLLGRENTKKLDGDKERLTLEELKAHYTRLQKFYERAYGEFSEVWGDMTGSRLFGNPEDFFSPINSEEEIEDEHLRRQFAGGIRTSERGFQPLALGTILEELLAKYNVRVHLGNTVIRTDYDKDRGYKLHSVSSEAEEGRDEWFKYVVNAAWHESPYLDLKALASHLTSASSSLEAASSHIKTKVYLRSIALVDISACEDAPKDRSYFGLLGRYGGMISLFNNKVASIFIPEEGLSYQGRHDLEYSDERHTLLGRETSDRFDELNVDKDEEESVQRRILRNAQKKYPFLREAKPIRLVTRTTISWDDEIYQRQHIQPQWTFGQAKRWLQAYATKATFSPLIALQVLGQLLKQEDIAEAIYLPKASQEFLNKIADFDFERSSLIELVKLPEEFVLFGGDLSSDGDFIRKMVTYADKRGLPRAIIENYENVSTEEPLGEKVSSTPLERGGDGVRLELREAEFDSSVVNILQQRSEGEFEVQLALTSRDIMAALIDSLLVLKPRVLFLKNFSIPQDSLNQMFLLNLVRAESIEEIRVTFKEKNAEDIREFLKYCEHIPALNKLFLAGNHIGPVLGAKIDPLIRLIERARSLTYIDASNNGLLSEIFPYQKIFLFDALRKTSSLRINLEGNGLTKAEEDEYSTSEVPVVVPAIVDWGVLMDEGSRRRYEITPVSPLLSVSLPDRPLYFVESVPVVGRESYLTRLWNEFHSHNKVALTARSFGESDVAAEIVSGMGGIGKTQLALAYAYEAFYKGVYDVIHWVYGETEKTRTESYRELLKKMGVADALNPDEVKRTVFEKLTESKRWLLIYDNVTRPEDLKGAVPGFGGHVLITSRHSTGWDGSEISLGVFQPEEACNYLLHKTHRGEEERKAAERVAEALGFLPLALSHASSYILENRMSFETYLTMFLTRSQELFGYHPDKSIGYRNRDLVLGGLAQPSQIEIDKLTKRAHLKDQYPYVIATTWSITAEKLSPKAKQLMRFIAYLEPDKIPMTVLHAILKVAKADAVNDDDATTSAVQELVCYSLVKSNNDRSISIHRLLQMVESSNQDEKEVEDTLLALKESLRSIFTYTNKSRTELLHLVGLTPHVLTLIRNYKKQTKGDGLLLLEPDANTHKLCIQLLAFLTTGIFNPMKALPFYKELEHSSELVTKEYLETYKPTIFYYLTLLEPDMREKSVRKLKMLSDSAASFKWKEFPTKKTHEFIHPLRYANMKMVPYWYHFADGLLNIERVPHLIPLCQGYERTFSEVKEEVGEPMRALKSTKLFESSFDHNLGILYFLNGSFKEMADLYRANLETFVEEKMSNPDIELLRLRKLKTVIDFFFRNDLEDTLENLKAEYRFYEETFGEDHQYARFLKQNMGFFAENGISASREDLLFCLFPYKLNDKQRSLFMDNLRKSSSLK